MPVDVLGGCHGHGLGGAPVEAALEDNDVLFAGRVPCKLDAGFHGFSPAIGEEEGVYPKWRDLIKRFRQGYRRRRDNDIHLPKDQLAGLLLDGLDDLWVAVTGVNNGNATGEVNISLTIGII